MNDKKIKIVADSSGDLSSLPSVDFTSAPLKIITSEKQYVDNSELDVLEMVNDLQSYKGKSSSSCPNSEDWLAAFGDAEEIYCITITATLSGSYNAAMLAKKTYEEKYPERRVFVLNSLTAGPEIALLIYKIQELILEGNSYEDICDTVTNYCNNTALLFMLESMKNLANNGRVSPLVAKMAGLLGIRVVGKASAKGDLEPLNKCRGEKRAIEEIFTQMKSIGYKGGKVKIAHCFNENAAKQLDAMIRSEFANAETEIYACGGLCSFYAEKHGMLVGFEHE
ncbi:MAG: DegV family protein [Clostridia bacterium]|nr:DegV family protein [Clostridia bacterium]